MPLLPGAEEHRAASLPPQPVPSAEGDGHGQDARADDAPVEERDERERRLTSLRWIHLSTGLTLPSDFFDNCGFSADGDTVVFSVGETKFTWLVLSRDPLVLLTDDGKVITVPSK